MSGRKVQVVGCGGHGKVVIRALQCLGDTVVRIYDDDSTKWGTALLDIPILGPTERIHEFESLPTIIAVGDNQARKRLAEKLNADWLTVVHPEAFVDSTVVLGRGVVVLPGAVIQVDSQIGNHVIVNSSASIDHDCVIQDYVHVAPGVNLAGRVNVDEGAFLGAGCTVIPGISIGAWAKIGSGAAVIRHIHAFAVAVGVPAKPIS